MLSHRVSLQTAHWTDQVRMISQPPLPMTLSTAQPHPTIPSTPVEGHRQRLATFLIWQVQTGFWVSFAEMELISASDLAQGTPPR